MATEVFSVSGVCTEEINSAVKCPMSICARSLPLCVLKASLQPACSVYSDASHFFFKCKTKCLIWHFSFSFSPSPVRYVLCLVVRFKLFHG